MTLGARLRNARKRCGYTQKQLAGMIGAKHNSVSNWENGLNMPDPATIERICSALNVTPNYLIGHETNASSIVPDSLSFAEEELLSKYRGLDSGTRGAVDALLNYYCGLAGAKISSLSAAHVDKPFFGAGGETTGFEVVRGIISTQSVAAGTGAYLDPDTFEEISVQKNDLTRRADFYVPVSGDSMEPRFHDGDILIVEQSTVNYGEIGIFTLDGHGYVKIRGKGELISLNAEYAPIPMNDDIICNGKVIGILETDWLVC